MALVLSTNYSSSQEPLRKFRWIFQFTAPAARNTLATEKLAIVCKSCNAPQLTFGETVSDRLNEKFKIAGKPTWNDITLAFLDYIDGENSAGHILYNWATALYDPTTGAMGFKNQYSTTGTLAQLKPDGVVARLWQIYYMWPQTVTFGEGFDSGAEDICDVSAVFKYDYAIKGTDVA